MKDQVLSIDQMRHLRDLGVDTQEEDILLKDLSTRLPYGVKVQLSTNEVGILHQIAKRTCTVFITPSDFFDVSINDIKPYLFPSSSITKDQMIELSNISNAIHIYPDTEIVVSRARENLLQFVPVFDWLNKNHFDYRGLISKRLAIDATNLNIY